MMIVRQHIIYCFEILNLRDEKGKKSMMNTRKFTDKIVTLIGVFQCLALLLPVGLYKIEPPPSYVGTLWGFLVAPTYITFIAG